MIVVTEPLVNFLIFVLALAGTPTGDGVAHVDILNNDMLVESHLIQREAEHRYLVVGSDGEPVGTIERVQSSSGHFVCVPEGQEPKLVDIRELRSALEQHVDRVMILNETYEVTYAPGAIYLRRGDTLMVLR